MSTNNPSPHWLDQYATKYHKWRTAHHGGREIYYRPLGLVESAFDTDGIYYEGRADLNVHLDIQIQSQLTSQELRDRIALAWAILRCEHGLLLSRAVSRQDYMSIDSRVSGERYFVIRPPLSAQEALTGAQDSLVFAENHYSSVDAIDFYKHAQNCGRVFDANSALAKLFVLPVERILEKRARLHMLLVAGHQITDGLTNAAWSIHFLKILNTPRADLLSALSSLITAPSILTKLPLPQEDLYPAIHGSRAKKRWFWLLTLVFRHVRKPLPAAFPNPLYRATPLTHAVPLPPSYAAVLDYSKTPPLNTFTVQARLNAPSTQRLHRLCREAGTSIGAGSFALVATVMMALHERQNPNTPAHQRRPFIAGFPINPRPLFSHPTAPNSLMLAFSDGVVLPFLPSSLDLDARLRLLARSAHRQLALYQKRVRPRLASAAELAAHMGSRGAGRVLAINYVAAVERADAKLPLHLRRGGGGPQGALAVRPNGSVQTCGVSSVGRTSPLLRPGQYDLDAGFAAADGADAFVADFAGLTQNVRARDGEFLVGVGGDDHGIYANVSFDGNAISEEMAVVWKNMMENLLNVEEQKPKL